MQVFRYSFPFNNLVGLIRCSEELKNLGIDSCDQHGHFFPKRAAELIQFCKQNHEYHIVSYMPNMKINKFIPGASLYFLANGDPNPQLLYSTALCEEELEIFKLRIAQLAA